MLKSRHIARFERSLKASGLPVGVRLWNGTTIAATEAPGVWITVRSPGVLGLLANPSMGRLARGYVEQQLDVEGGARDAVRVAEALSGAQDHGPRSRRRLHPWISHTRFFDRKAVNHHYDVSDEFFGLWLDRQRVYSCAYFRRADDTLELAQEQKLDHICRKLRLAPGERFLDIGCGWGALVMRAASRFGARALGVTLSRNQHAYAQAAIRERGLEDRCEVRLLDYRDIPGDGGFDKIASVGMFEHVGRRILALYFRTIARLLRPGGLVLNHGITLNAPDQRELGSGIGEFIDDYVFPGGELVHLSQVVSQMSAQGLEVADVESLRPHYARTLWTWVDRLEAARAAAVAAVGEKTYRIWRIYMAGSAHAFERGWMSIYQVLAGKPHGGGELAVPPTRDDIYAV
jgi:cyclopropane-fatty-acyl-phospholipid synthase